MPAFTAVAAALGRELTVPEVAQTVILTRYSARAGQRSRSTVVSLTSRESRVSDSGLTPA